MLCIGQAYRALQLIVVVDLARLTQRRLLRACARENFWANVSFLDTAPIPGLDTRTGHLPCGPWHSAAPKLEQGCQNDDPDHWNRGT
jgi:hypothetical protein